MTTNNLTRRLMVVALLFATVAIARPGGSVSQGQKVGKPKPGLAAHYYRDDPFWGGNWTSDFLPKVAPEKWAYSKYLHTRVEALVNHSFVNRSWFSVRMIGQINVPNLPQDAETDDKPVSFFLVIDHGARLWVDGKIVVDGWTPKLGGGREVKGTVRLKPGTHAIVLEAFIGANTRLKDGLLVKLFWQSDGYGIKKAVVPAESLTHRAENLIPEKGRKDTQSKTIAE